MRPYLFIVLLFAISCSTNDQSIQEDPSNMTLNFEIPDSLSDQVILTQISGDLISPPIDTIILDEEGKGSSSLEIDYPQYIQMETGDIYRSIFIGPEGGLTVRVDTSKQTLVYKGHYAKENTYLEEIRNNKRLKRYGWNSGDKVSLDSFKTKLDQYFSVKKELLDSFFPSPSDQENQFYDLRLIELKAFKNYGLLSFINGKFKGEEFNEVFIQNIDKDFLDYEKMIPYLGNDYVLYLYNRSMIDYWGIQKYGNEWQAQKTKRGHYTLALEIAEEQYPSSLKQKIIENRLFALTQMVDYYSSKYPSIPFLLNKYGNLLGEMKKQELENNLRNRIQKSIAYEKGKPFPVLTLLNDKGEEVKTSQEDNIPVLYDIWASWCGPCIKNFPHVKELEEKYQGKLKVISVSLDNDPEDHLKALQKLEVPGNAHLWAEGGFKSDFAKFFQIIAIPTYILTDPKGNIAEFGHLNKVYEAVEKL